MKKQMFKATIFSTAISMYRKKRGYDLITFDSIIKRSKESKRSPGKELIIRLQEITHCVNEFCLLEYLKDKAIEDFGDWPRNLQETIWSLLRPF